MSKLIFVAVACGPLVSIGIVSAQDPASSGQQRQDPQPSG
jgi:hypothetical protein